jgi:hypothetical protein
MTITARAVERAFPTFPKGHHRDEILRSFRIGMRLLTNPDTGQPFTEREIATATGRLSRYWRESDAIDLVLLAGQQRALYLADQVRLDRAASSWLTGFHGRLWRESPLPASGGSGQVTADAVAGTVFTGSTTVPSPVAVQGTDPAGKTYQVLYSAVTPVGGTATLVLQGVDTGADTNPSVGTQITWSQNRPIGAAEKATVSTQFTGGAPSETDAAFASRLQDLISHRPAAGNSAHFRAWARAASVAVEDAFVYSCAMYAGTVVVCVLQQRGSVLGPLARVPSIGTLGAVTSYLVPPGSPVVPLPPWVLVVAPTTQSADLVLSVSIPAGVSSGWADLTPWPEQAGGLPCTVTNVVDQQNFEITRAAGSAGLPTGVTAPSLMLWDEDTSRWESLLVTSVTAAGGDAFDVVLSSPPTMTVAMGQVVSPDLYSDTRRELTAQTLDAYFDSLGPGEVVNLATSPLGHRAFRYPQVSEGRPQRAGAAVLTWLQDALGAALADSVLESISSTVPAVPTTPAAGPALMVQGTVGIYPL